MRKETIPLCILKGNQGLVVELNDIRITSTRHNGIMNVIREFQINIKDLKKIIEDYEKE